MTREQFVAFDGWLTRQIAEGRTFPDDARPRGVIAAFLEFSTKPVDEYADFAEWECAWKAPANAWFTLGCLVKVDTESNGDPAKVREVHRYRAQIVHPEYLGLPPRTKPLFRVVQKPNEPNAMYLEMDTGVH